jgi:multimeric flavodoxin WrbA
MIPEPVQALIDAEVAANTVDYSDLRAVYLNGTLKRSPESSHTDELIDISAHVLRGVGVKVDHIRTVDYVVPPGIFCDMREHGWAQDDFPNLYLSLVAPADIVVIATPVWLGDQSSMTRLAIERLYAWSSELNPMGQWSYYGKVGGTIVTGNEDGAKHCAAQILYALSHMGFTIPPQADAYGNGEAGPGPSHLDDQGGTTNSRTTRNTVVAAWNLLHTARRIKDVGGIPPHGNVAAKWDLARPEHPDPEHRG